MHFLSKSFNLRFSFTFFFQVPQFYIVEHSKPRDNLLFFFQSLYKTQVCINSYLTTKSTN